MQSSSTPNSNKNPIHSILIQEFSQYINNFIPSPRALSQITSKYPSKSKRRLNNDQTSFLKENLLKCETKLKHLEDELTKLNNENLRLKSQLNAMLNQDNILKILEIITTLQHAFLGPNKIPKEIINHIHLQIWKRLQVPLPIKKYEPIISIEGIHGSYICAIIELRDKRIAACSSDQSISIYSIDYKAKTFNVDIKKNNAHSQSIDSLCEISEGRIVTCSRDNNIKVWKLKKNDISLMKTLSSHQKTICKVIVLDNKRWASCSKDKRIIIWSNDLSFEKLETISNPNSVTNILKLKRKNILIIAIYYTPAILVRNLGSRTNIKKIDNIQVSEASHMIELPNENIAISDEKTASIFIIDGNNFNIVKTIQNTEKIPHCSSLCVFDKFSFIYVYKTNLVRISSLNYSILSSDNYFEELDGEYGIIVTQKFRYVIVTKKTTIAIEIIKISY